MMTIPQAQTVHGNHVLVHACVCMPDRFHGVIEVLEPMEWSLGDILRLYAPANGTLLILAPEYCFLW